MKRYFNTEGVCYPDEHYMVNLDKRLSEIKEMVDKQQYFVINRGRQYGKTTTLFALTKYLRKDYVVVRLDFQQLSSDLFENGKVFSCAFADIFTEALGRSGEDQFLDKSIFSILSSKNPFTDMRELFKCLSNLCKTAPKPIVLMIDEVDQASNNQVFLDFLAQLRFYYLKRKETPTFQSVILAGVYDIKNLKLKLRPESDHKFNSPWNIASEFNVPMNFSPEDIGSMLKEYEADHKTGMEISKIAQSIYDYTSGYPVLVSSICKIIDEKLSRDEQFQTLAAAWTEAGVTEAVRLYVKDKAEPAMIFQSLTKHVDQYPKLSKMLKEILFEGEPQAYSDSNLEVSLGTMFGFIKEKNGKIQIANRIFEMKLYNKFLIDDSEDDPACKSAKNDTPEFTRGNKLNMDLVLEKFVEYFADVYEANDEAFIEKQGRKLFLIYLRPIINGVGNYYVEAETRNSRRSDVVVDYLGKRFVIELKIWRGAQYHIEGEKQLTDYLNDFHLDKGYLLTFSFNKNKQVGLKTVNVEGKTLLEATV